MLNAKVWISGVIIGVALAGTAFMFGAPAAGLAKSAPELKDHWRHHDGHWSYWSAADNQWYYTDGTNWFYNSGESWAPYRFDKSFGREGFERGEYKIPAAEAKIVVPRHEVYRPRK